MISDRAGFLVIPALSWPPWPQGATFQHRWKPEKTLLQSDTHRLSTVFRLTLVLVFGLAGSACDNLSYHRTWEQLEPYAKLTKPTGDGPFPAVVLLHGCGGMQNAFDHGWGERLARWGYVSLQVDSFAPRRISGVCAGGMIALEVLPYRIHDAYMAKKYLAGLPFVSPGRIGVMGWSHGGTTTLGTVGKDAAGKNNAPFRAAVAFYPYCHKPIEPAAPLLILSGGRDRWTPVEFCLRHAPVENLNGWVDITVYPKAYHCFDWVGIDTTQEGYILKYHPKAAADAFDRVKAFFTRHL